MNYDNPTWIKGTWNGIIAVKHRQRGYVKVFQDGEWFQVSLDLRREFKEKS